MGTEREKRKVHIHSKELVLQTLNNQKHGKQASSLYSGLSNHVTAALEKKCDERDKISSEDYGNPTREISAIECINDQCPEVSSTTNDVLADTDNSKTCSQQTEFVDQVQQTELVDCSQQTELVDCSQQTESVDFSQQTESVDCSQQTESVDFSQQTESVDCSQQTESVDCSQQSESVDFSQQTESVDCSQQSESVDCSQQSDCSQQTELEDQVQQANSAKSEDPSQQTESIDPSQQTDSDNPSQQTNSVDPSQQTESDDPSQQTDSDDPSQQTESVDPSQQTESVDPSQQTESDDPSQQTDSDDPSQQTDLDDPSQQTESVELSQQTKSVDPSQQTKSADPSQQTESDDQSQQTDSDDSSQQTESVDPSQQTESVDPSQQTKSADSSQQTESVDPSQQTDSDDSSQQTESVDPSQQTESVDPSQQTESVDPSQQTESVDPSQQTKSDDPSQQTDLDDPSQHTESVELSQQTESADPSQQTESADPSQQTESVDPSQQTESVDPSQQAESVDPSQQTESVDPSQQTESDDPSQQTDSDNPSQETESVDPSQQTESVDLSQKTNSDNPSQQTDSDNPSQQAESVDPSQQTESVYPSQQTESVDPSQQTESVDPSQQTESDDPSQQTDLDDSSQQTESVELSQQTESADPSQQTESADPSQQTESVDPSQQTESVNPSQQTESVDPSQQTESDDPSQQTESDDPSQQTESVDPSQQTESVDPSQQTESDDPSQQTESVDPSQQTESDDPSQQTESVDPSQQTDSDDPSQQTESVNPSQQIDPDDPSQQTDLDNRSQQTESVKLSQETESADPSQQTESVDPSQQTDSVEVTLKKCGGHSLTSSSPRPKPASSGSHWIPCTGGLLCGVTLLLVILCPSAVHTLPAQDRDPNDCFLSGRPDAGVMQNPEESRALSVLSQLFGFLGYVFSSHWSLFLLIVVIILLLVYLYNKRTNNDVSDDPVTTYVHKIKSPPPTRMCDTAQTQIRDDKVCSSVPGEGNVTISSMPEKDRSPPDTSQPSLKVQMEQIQQENTQQTVDSYPKEQLHKEDKCADKESLHSVTSIDFPPDSSSFNTGTEVIQEEVQMQLTSDTGDSHTEFVDVHKPILEPCVDGSQLVTSGKCPEIPINTSTPTIGAAEVASTGACAGDGDSTVKKKLDDLLELDETPDKRSTHACTSPRVFNGRNDKLPEPDPHPLEEDSAIEVEPAEESSNEHHVPETTPHQQTDDSGVHSLSLNPTDVSDMMAVGDQKEDDCADSNLHTLLLPVPASDHNVEGAHAAMTGSANQAGADDDKFQCGLKCTEKSLRVPQFTYADIVCGKRQRLFSGIPQNETTYYAYTQDVLPGESYPPDDLGTLPPRAHNVQVGDNIQISGSNSRLSENINFKLDPENPNDKLERKHIFTSDVENHSGIDRKPQRSPKHLKQREDVSQNTIQRMRFNSTSSISSLDDEISHSDEVTIEHQVEPATDPIPDGTTMIDSIPPAPQIQPSIPLSSITHTAASFPSSTSDSATGTGEISSSEKLPQTSLSNVKTKNYKEVPLQKHCQKQPPDSSEAINSHPFWKKILTEKNWVPEGLRVCLVYLYNQTDDKSLDGSEDESDGEEEEEFANETDRESDVATDEEIVNDIGGAISPIDNRIVDSTPPERPLVICSGITVTDETQPQVVVFVAGQNEKVIYRMGPFSIPQTTCIVPDPVSLPTEESDYEHDRCELVGLPSQSQSRQQASCSPVNVLTTEIQIFGCSNCIFINSLVEAVPINASQAVAIPQLNCRLPQLPRVFAIMNPRVMMIQIEAILNASRAGVWATNTANHTYQAVSVLCIVSSALTIRSASLVVSNTHQTEYFRGWLAMIPIDPYPTLTTTTTDEALPQNFRLSELLVLWVRFEMRP